MTSDSATQSRDEIAHQAIVEEETGVGTKGSGDPRVKGIRIAEGCSKIHPELADRLEAEYGVEFPHKYGLEVADTNQNRTQEER